MNYETRKIVTVGLGATSITAIEETFSKASPEESLSILIGDITAFSNELQKVVEAGESKYTNEIAQWVAQSKKLVENETQAFLNLHEDTLKNAIGKAEYSKVMAPVRESNISIRNNLINISSWKVKDSQGKEASALVYMENPRATIEERQKFFQSAWKEPVKSSSKPKTGALLAIVGTGIALWSILK